MTLRKKINSRFKLLLRRSGMLCRKPKAKSKRIRIKQTINPDGSVTNHDHLTEQPLYNGSTFETELHIWKEIHKGTEKTKSKK